MGGGDEQDDGGRIARYAREEERRTVSRTPLERTAATAQLAEDEIRALALLAKGFTADAAARELEISTRTLRRRCRDICDRLDVHTPVEAVVWAAKRSLI